MMAGTKKRDKGVLAAAFTLAGSIVGAGILGLPYVFSQSGMLLGLFWLILFGVIITFCYLYLGEVTLRTKERHQLPGLAETYLGKKGKYLTICTIIYGMYLSLMAYLIAEGHSISQLFTGGTSYAIHATLLFWIVLVILLAGGIERLKKVETYGVLAIVLIIIGIFIVFAPSIEVENLSYTESNHIFLPLGVVLFSLLGFAAVPELKEELRENKKAMKKAIILGSILPIILYILFTVSFVGILGKGVSEIATLSFGPAIIILGIFTMFTSYFSLSFSLKDIFEYDMNLSHRKAFFWSAIFPVFIFLAFTFFGWTDFIEIIGIGGVITGGLTGIIVVVMNYKAKQQKKGTRKPEYVIPINKFIIAIFSAIFILGIIVQVMNTIG